MIKQSKVFRCWSKGNDMYDLTIEEDTLFVHIDVPQPFKWIIIKDTNNVDCYSKVYVSKECKCHLNIQNAGKYYFTLFCSNNGISYHSFIGGKQIIMDLNKHKEWYFLLPQFAVWNHDLIKTGALKYVLTETILNNEKSMSIAAQKISANYSNIRDKVLAIHDFVANHLYYDYDALNRGNDTNRTIEQIIKEKKCVCQGYADLTLALLKSIGIHAENILCFAICDIYENGWSKTKNRTSDINHIITRVELENRWLYMDVTWDSNNKYENGEYIKGESASHRYFDVTIPFLSTTHRFLKK